MRKILLRLITIAFAFSLTLESFVNSYALSESVAQVTLISNNMGANNSNVSASLTLIQIPDVRRMLIPLYSYPSGQWTSVVDANTYGNIDVVVNPSSGPGAVLDSGYVNGIAQLRSAGVVVFGYVYTAYGARPLPSVMAEIDLWQNWYDVDGIFLDEAGNTSTTIPYYSDLQTYITSKSMLSILNPGTNTIEPYASIADINVIYEHNSSIPLSVSSWVANYPASSFAALQYAASVEQMRDFVANAISNNIGYIYVTNDAPPNPWDELPPYLAEEAALLANGTALPTTSGISNVTVNEDAPDTMIDLWPSFADLEDSDNLLSYTVTANTNAALFTSYTIAGGQYLVLDYAPNLNGSAQITVRATDSSGLFVETSFTVTVAAVNDAPVCADVLAGTLEDTSVQTDPSCTDAESNPLTFSIVTQPLHGTASVAAGKLVYTPVANYNGPDAFTYKANDLSIDSNNSTVNVNVTAVNDAPVATPQSLTTVEDTTLYITLSGLDVENDPLNFTIVTPPTNGSLSGIAPDIVYTPDANYNGTDSFTFRINDGLANSNIAIVDVIVTAVNDAPTFTSSAVIDATEATSYTYNITTADSDVSDTLTITAPVLPAWLTLVDHGNGTASLDGIPTNANVGSNSIILRVSDGIVSVDQIFAIVVLNVNNAPSFISTPVTIATEDSVYTYNIATEDIDLGDTLTITAPILPVWLTLTDNGDGTAMLNGTPTNSNVGTNNVTLRIDDGNVSVDQLFTIDVANTNDIPTDITLSNNIVDEGQPVGTPVGVLSTTDPDNGDSFSYSFCGGPDDSFFQFGSSTLETSVILDADIRSILTICIHAEDAGGLFIEKQFSINISNVNDAPVISVQSYTKNVNESTPLFFDSANATLITISDPDAGNGNIEITLTVTQGTLTLSTSSGLSFTPPANGSANASMTFTGTLNAVNTALNGTRYDPIPGYNGNDTLQITVNDLGNTGSGTNQTDSASIDLTILSLPPRVVTNGINTLSDTGDGVLSENEIVKVDITQFLVTFDQDLNNPVGDSDPKDVTNPANFLLVHDNADGFQTTSCVIGVNAQDIVIPINSVTYDNNGGGGPFVATVNINDGFPLAYGNYRFFICGTTSITDPYGFELVGDGVQTGTDMIRSFSILNTSGNGGNTGGGNTINLPTTGVLIPFSGYAPGEITKLPAQIESLSYNAKDDLRLEIPSLSINQPIVGIQYKDGWDVTWLGSTIGFLEGSAYPTWSGNTVLTGHSTDPNGNITSLAYIKILKVGDNFMLHAYGQVYIYRVQENLLLSPTSLSALFKHENYDWVTLVTCENWNKNLKIFSERRIVRAALISVIPEK